MAHFNVTCWFGGPRFYQHYGEGRGSSLVGVIDLHVGD